MKKDTDTSDQLNTELKDSSVAFQMTVKAIASFFIIVILVTSLLTLSGYKAWPELGENRSLAKYPDTNLSTLADRKYYNKVNEWISDNHAFRTPLVALHSFISVYLFGAALNEKTLIGKDGWYFYGFGSMRDDFTRKTKLEQNPSYLKSILIYLEELYFYGQETKRHILFMVAPNKHNIYSQFYSEKYKFGEMPGTAKKIEMWLSANYPSMVAPIVDELIFTSRKQKIYYKTDTHWNYLGAKIAVDQLMQAINHNRPKTKIINDKSYKLEERTFHRGNFVKLLGLPLSEQSHRPKPISGWNAKVNKKMQSQLKQKYIKHRPRKFVLLQNKNLNHANFMMIGDSFMRMMIPYAAERFTQSLFYNPWACKNEHNCHFPEKLIQRFSPDILLLQVVERRFQACKSRLSKACQTKVNGKMPFKIKQMRLKAKFDTGEPLTRIAQLKKTNVKNKFVIDASSTFVTVPNDAIVVAKLTFPTQTSGIVKPIRNKLPLRVKHEQTRVRLKPNMKSAYLVLDYDRLKNKAYISFEKTNIDFNNFKFELKYFKDRTSLINFKEALQLSNRKDHSHHKILK